MLTIVIRDSERVCANCEYYRLYYTKMRTKSASFMPSNSGFCLVRNCKQRKPGSPSCRKFLLSEEITKAQVVAI